jgi:hypothetical protein
MPRYLLHVGATANCPHGGQITVQPGNSRVLVGGRPVATASDEYPVTVCTFTVGNKSQPCVKVQWQVPATRVMVGGQPVILQTSMGMCVSAEQATQGAPQINTTQTRVTGL